MILYLYNNIIFKTSPHPHLLCSGFKILFRGYDTLSLQVKFNFSFQENNADRTATIRYQQPVSVLTKHQTIHEGGSGTSADLMW